MGSGGDVFGWFGFVIIAALIDAIMQFVVLMLPRFAPLSTRMLVILSSILLWIASMAWVRHVGVP
jgi:hypothetical protein